MSSKHLRWTQRDEGFIGMKEVSTAWTDVQIYKEKASLFQRCGILVVANARGLLSLGLQEIGT